MPAVRLPLALFLALVAAATGCSSHAETQWYKPNADYTVAEFERDRRACTRDRKLDETCLRARGWVSLTGDVPGKPTGPQAPEPPRLRAR